MAGRGLDEGRPSEPLAAEPKVSGLHTLPRHFNGALGRQRPAPTAASKERASGWRLTAASDAAVRSACSSNPAPSTSVSAGSVSVPVLSNTTVSTLGQPLQRGRRFQQHAGAEQPAGGDDLHDRHGERQSAGTGDDQHGAGGQQRLASRHAGNEIPPEERRQRGQVHRWRIAPRNSIGEHDEARAARLRRLDQPHAFGEQGAAAGGRGARPSAARRG